MYAKGTILKKINVSFIVDFCLGEYRFRLNTFWTHLINQLNYHVSFCVMANKAEGYLFALYFNNHTLHDTT